MHTLSAVQMLNLHSNVRTRHPYRQGAPVKSASSMALSDTHNHTQIFNTQEVAINTNIHFGLINLEDNKKQFERLRHTAKTRPAFIQTAHPCQESR